MIITSFFSFLLLLKFVMFSLLFIIIILSELSLYSTWKRSQESLIYFDMNLVLSSVFRVKNKMFIRTEEKDVKVNFTK